MREVEALVSLRWGMSKEKLILAEKKIVMWSWDYFAKMMKWEVGAVNGKIVAVATVAVAGASL